MKYGILFVLTALLFSACKKGKKLPETVYVYYNPITTAGVSPQDHFDKFDPNDIYETLQYPSYVHDITPEEMAARFNENIAYHLSNNNIELSTDQTLTYELDVTSLHLSESLNRQSYADSCSSGASSYVYYSDLQADVYAVLYKNGVAVDSWHRTGMSGEKVRTKTNKCNEHKIRAPLCGIGCLIERVSKELRMKVSRKIYELEGY